MNFKHIIQQNPTRAQYIVEREMNYQLIKDALSLTNGNKTEAAKLLGISRITLANRIHIYEIDL
jgi:DNA-binding NtrC family response regulator